MERTQAVPGNEIRTRDEFFLKSVSNVPLQHLFTADFRNTGDKIKREKILL